eukprot:g83259.t1
MSQFTGAVGKGLVGGATGVFLTPWEAAKKDGVKGFAKGVGVGVVGLIAKPIGGAVDFASSTLKAANWVLVSKDGTQLMRIRGRRTIGQDGILRPFDWEEEETRRALKK